MSNNIQIYKTAIYLRLSQEDGDLFSASGKSESNSISTQRSILMTYIDQHEDLSYYGEFVDDGYSGSNFDRPDFNRLMEKVKSRELDCIIVKDLSRFGRDYIDSGNLIQKILPHFGVRFIAVNDNYDSLYADSTESSIYLPFKNLVNDSYSRDISNKVRSALEARRQNGICVAAQLPFGYCRDPNTKEIRQDEYAAEIVRTIFEKVIQGYSIQKTADWLSSQGISSPMDYKQNHGVSCNSPFRKNANCKWSYQAVRRILCNEMYIGTLTQGKTTKVSHRIKKIVPKDQSQWVRVENAVAPIVSVKQFRIVQELIAGQVRACDVDNTAGALAGKIVCKDCGALMMRRSFSGKSGRKNYYTCHAHAMDSSVCSTHSIPEDDLNATILASVKAQISTMLMLSKALTGLDGRRWEQKEAAKIDRQIEELTTKRKRTETLYRGIYEDYKDEIISLEDYQSFGESLRQDLSSMEANIGKLHTEREDILTGKTGSVAWLESYRQYENIESITRDIAVAMIDKVLIGVNKQVIIRYRMGEYVEDALQLLSHDATTPSPAAAKCIPMPAMKRNEVSPA